MVMKMEMREGHAKKEVFHENFNFESSSYNGANATQKRKRGVLL